VAANSEVRALTLLDMLAMLVVTTSIRANCSLVVDTVVVTSPSSGTLPSANPLTPMRVSSRISPALPTTDPNRHTR
jgi:hypothetical protein